MSRVIVWYSDGAASACAAKLAIDKYGDRVRVIKCDTTGDEHPDNVRFRRDVEQWIGRGVELIRSEKYGNIDDVFETTRYMAGIAGARCTTELKKIPRHAFQRDGDIHIFGYTVEEGSRVKMFETNHPELICDWILVRQFVRKKDCHRMLREAQIKQPAMYGLGFEHNNCIGCVKATSPGYWNRVRTHFPGVFERRAKQSREINARLVRVDGARVFLDELPENHGHDEPDGNIECGPFCQTDLLDDYNEEAK